MSRYDLDNPTLQRVADTTIAWFQMHWDQFPSLEEHQASFVKLAPEDWIGYIKDGVLEVPSRMLNQTIELMICRALGLSIEHLTSITPGNAWGMLEAETFNACLDVIAADACFMPGTGRRARQRSINSEKVVVYAFRRL